MINHKSCTCYIILTTIIHLHPSVYGWYDDIWHWGFIRYPATSNSSSSKSTIYDCNCCPGFISWSSSQADREKPVTDKSTFIFGTNLNPEKDQANLPLWSSWNSGHWLSTASLKPSWSVSTQISGQLTNTVVGQWKVYPIVSDDRYLTVIFHSRL